jgi:hypothetical protein
VRGWTRQGERRADSWYWEMYDHSATATGVRSAGRGYPWPSPGARRRQSLCDPFTSRADRDEAGISRLWATSLCRLRGGTASGCRWLTTRRGLYFVGERTPSGGLSATTSCGASSTGGAFTIGGRTGCALILAGDSQVGGVDPRVSPETGGSSTAYVTSSRGSQIQPQFWG